MYVGRLVRLRAFEPTDVETLYQYFNDAEVTSTLALRYPVSRADEQKFVSDHSTVEFGKAHFAIDTLADGRLIGGCGFHWTSPENREGEFGIAIGDKTLWGQGFGTDATRVLCRFGFEQMNLYRISLWVRADHPRARSAYERAGFVIEGVARGALYKQGVQHDVTMMSLLRGELRLDD